MQRTAERETTRKRETHIEPAQQSPKPWAKAEACSNTGKQRQSGMRIQVDALQKYAEII